jgi:hypothetical protein
MFPRLGIHTLTQIERPPQDFWPPQASRDPAGHGHTGEPAMLLRLAGVAAVIAIMIAAALST